MLSESVIKEVLDVALSTSGDFAELFLEDRQDQNLMMIGHRVEKANGVEPMVQGFEYSVATIQFAVIQMTHLKPIKLKLPRT